MSWEMFVLNCCDHGPEKADGNGNTPGHSHKGRLSHLWMMAVCCGAPLILFSLALLLGSRLPGLKALLLAAAPFICPVMMIGMLPMMLMHGKRKDGRYGPENQIDGPEEDRRD